ncbi:MAG: DMT family transporter [Patescibacteria group bacterium]|nr:DMT family transporter [Patescibacteria group bacterium]
MSPVLALIITNIIWGGAPPIFKFALENIPPFTLAFVRFFFAGLIFLPFLIRKFPSISPRKTIGVFLVGFFGIFINITFFFLGLKKTESINTPIIASAGPVFLYFLSIVFLKERPRLKVLSGMMIALVGVLIIVLSPILISKRELVFGEIEGNIFIVIATLGTIIATIIGKDVLKVVSPYFVSCFSFLTASLLFLIFVPSELRDWSFADLNLNGWTGIIYGVFLSSAMAYFLYYYGISKLDAQEVGVFTYLDPIVAVVIAYFLLGEVPSLWYLLGSFFVFGGIYVAEGRFHWHPIRRLKVAR